MSSYAPLSKEVLRLPAQHQHHGGGWLPNTRSVSINALAETVNGLYKTEFIRRCGPWRTPEQVELATLAWVDWWNTRRPHGACEGVPPAEFEAQYYRQQRKVGEAA